MNLNPRRNAAILFLSACFALPAIAATPVEETQTLMARGDLDGALKRIDRFLAASPQDAEGRFTRALILVKLNKTADAIKAFTDLTRDYPQLPEPYNNLAVLYAQAGDYEKARDALEAALATNPSYATAHENLGDIYAALAGAAYNRALQLDQSNQATRYKLSLIGQVSGVSGTTIPGAKPGAATGPAATPSTAAVTPTAAPAAAAATGPVSPSGQAALSALDAWALAWSSKNADAYLAAYAPDFVPDGGLARSEWEAQRRTRIQKPKSISVHLLNTEVESVDAKTVRISFTQDYQSDTISDKITKNIELHDVGGNWKIFREVIR